MNIKIIGIVAKGVKNTRYLGENEAGVYYSFKDANGLYAVGMTCDISEEYLQANPRQEWIDSCNKKNLRESIISHLVKYKTEVLKDKNEGSFRGSQYSHVLVDGERNLILKHDFDNVLNRHYCDIKKRNELHVGFANMNSSQAFALNFFCPLIEKRIIGSLFEIEDSYIVPKDCVFEHILSDSEQTQFDFYIKGNVHHSPVSVEVKYTEKDFGIADIDASHIRKYEEEYKGTLAKLTKEELSITEFFTKYQLWRNLLYVLKEQTVCFMFPRFREDLAKSVQSAIQNCKDEFQGRIKIIYADDIAQKMIHGKDSALREFFTEFSRKYLKIE